MKQKTEIEYLKMLSCSMQNEILELKTKLFKSEIKHKKATEIIKKLRSKK